MITLDEVGSKLNPEGQGKLKETAPNLAQFYGLNLTLKKLHGYELADKVEFAVFYFEPFAGLPQTQAVFKRKSGGGMFTSDVSTWVNDETIKAGRAFEVIANSVDHFVQTGQEE